MKNQNNIDESARETRTADAHFELSALTPAHIREFFKEHRAKSPDRQRAIPDEKACRELAALANALKAHFQGIVGANQAFDKDNIRLTNRISDVTKSAVDFRRELKIYITLLKEVIKNREIALSNDSLHSGAKEFCEVENTANFEIDLKESQKLSAENSLETAEILFQNIDEFLVDGNKSQRSRFGWNPIILSSRTRLKWVRPITEIQDLCISALSQADVTCVSRDADDGPVSYVTAQIIGWVQNKSVRPAAIRAQKRAKLGKNKSELAS